MRLMGGARVATRDLNVLSLVSSTSNSRMDSKMRSRLISGSGPKSK